eukprot:TRINITY_DN18680_c0_g1_i2.p1 TRINITY_DN18680_c0_g1~~TRINITY_DN18680_c0_g1_i2.p1  ORF type:complete len:304 (-),score=41.87 TRINITY_DN18680_c0_g1_i2:47-829(-)
MPGHYILDQHISVGDGDPTSPCILISATRDVILEGNGHFVTYTYLPDYERQITAISIVDAINITIVDITVDSFDTGIYARNIQDLTITSAIVKGTDSFCVNDCTGIVIEGATKVTIKDTVISDFGNNNWTPSLNQSCLGMHFSDVASLTVQSCTIQNIKARRGPVSDGPIANIGGTAGGIAVMSTSRGIFQDITIRDVLGGPSGECSSVDCVDDGSGFAYGVSFYDGSEGNLCHNVHLTGIRSNHTSGLGNNGVGFLLYE